MTVDGRNLKMDIVSPGRSGTGSIVFHGERREMLVVDHDSKSYQVIDQEAIKAIAGQVNQAMSTVEEALKNVPEDQRAMVEKMMKERMPTPPAAAAPKDEVRKTAQRGEKNGYPCVKYEVLRGDRVVRELWVTDWDNIDGGEEAIEAFQGMAEFFQEMLDAFASSAGGMAGLGDLSGSIMAQMKAIDGFPVVTKEFGADGSLDGESSLRSAKRRSLDPAEFEPPSGYKRRSMFGQ